MRSILRLILILLTAVAVPIQGLAAAGMMHCAASTMPTHQHAGLSMGGNAQPHSHHGIAADTAADASADDLGTPAALTLNDAPVR